jgi:1,4-dihydroxy-2-naphthoyl-CoA hydrolase
MSIWFDKPSLEEMNRVEEGTLTSHLGIEIVEMGDDYLVATMPVDARTKQPRGLLHGGASAVLAETIGSAASSRVVDIDAMLIAGIHVEATHVRAVTDGFVRGIGRPLHLGRTMHVWDVRIENDRGELVSTAKLTVAIRPLDGSAVD